MAMPRFSCMLSARKNCINEISKKNPEEDRKPDYSIMIYTSSSTVMHPYETQMFTQSSSEIWRAEKNKNIDKFSSQYIDDVLKRNEYIIPKTWTEEQLIGTNTNSGWESLK